MAYVIIVREPPPPKTRTSKGINSSMGLLYVNATPTEDLVLSSPTAGTPHSELQPGAHPLIGLFPVPLHPV